MKVIDQAALDVLRDLQDDEDPHMLKDLIIMFLESTPERLAKMKSAISDQESKVLILEAHTLKSSSANLGAMLMRDACLKLETLGHTGGFDGATELLEDLEKEYQRAKAELKLHAK